MQLSWLKGQKHGCERVGLCLALRIDFRGRAVAVAASNRHSAALTSAGEVFTWGSNADGCAQAAVCVVVTAGSSAASQAWAVLLCARYAPGVQAAGLRD